jgi:uncharacterized membrane protein
VGLKTLAMPPIVGITLRALVALIVLGLISIPVWQRYSPGEGSLSAWMMIIIGGGILAGSLGMWSFYSSLAASENLGVTLAIAFAVAPLAGTLMGLIRGDQAMDLRTALGMLAIVGGIVLVQLGRGSQH